MPPSGRSFAELKKTILSNKATNPTARWDTALIDLIDLINQHEDYCTESSGAARVVVFFAADDSPEPSLALLGALEPVNEESSEDEDGGLARRDSGDEEEQEEESGQENGGAGKGKARSVQFPLAFSSTVSGSQVTDVCVCLPGPLDLKLSTAKLVSHLDMRHPPRF